MVVIAVVTATEVVETLVAILVTDEPVLGTLTVAGEEHVALTALLW